MTTPNTNSLSPEQLEGLAWRIKRRHDVGTVDRPMSEDAVMILQALSELAARDATIAELRENLRVVNENKCSDDKHWSEHCEQLRQMLAYARNYVLGRLRKMQAESTYETPEMADVKSDLKAIDALLPEPPKEA